MQDKKIGLIILCVIVSIFICKTFFFNIVTVSGPSMNPTLKSGQMVATKILHKEDHLCRFDIVSALADKRMLIKRVIGLPKETIEYKDNALYVNGKKTNEPYIEKTFTEDLKIVLGEDEYFLLGDNRENSLDSRYYGAFSREKIKGKLIKELK